MFEQAELRSTKRGPSGPPKQQERRKSSHKSISQKTGPFGDVTETAILAILASHFRARVATPKKKPHLGSGLDQRDKAIREVSPTQLSAFPN